MDIKEINRLYDEKKSEFLHKRIEQENAVKDFREKLEKLDKRLFEGIIELPEDISLQALVPELYKEVVDVDIYIQQLDKANQLFNKISKVVNDTLRATVSKMLDLPIDEIDISNAAEYYVKCRDAVFSTRAKQELAVKMFAEKFKQVDSTVFSGIEIPEDISLQGMVPELYAQNPNQEIYREQLRKAMVFFNEVRKIYEDSYEEAMECLSEYKVLSSSGR